MFGRKVLGTVKRKVETTQKPPTFKLLLFWLVLSDEQMSNWVGVKHLPVFFARCFGKGTDSTHGA